MIGWGDDEPTPRLADLLEQLGIEEPEWERESPSILPTLRIFQWLSGAVILAGGFLGYLGYVPVWEGTLAIFCGGVAAFVAEAAGKDR